MRSSTVGALLAVFIVAPLALVGALAVLVLACGAIESHPASAAVRPPPPPVPITLVSQRLLVDDEHWTAISFRLTRESSVSFDVEAVQGGNVTLHLVPASDYAHFRAAKGSIWGGGYLRYQEFDAEEMRHFRRTAGFDAGDYVLVVSESSGVNILGAPDTSTIDVKVVATPMMSPM